ncbi:hypothetical protein BME96_09025 [Virgibacillus halodenitrificans]|uniref:Peptidase S74 domain-containing protein n=1 Tax=Virgibacillus halodenitrificans TaxID=1482 RepID=A0AAC9J001_VIRHA|nr:phage tail spike protein [Virgibacillus halodenitrificans]APC48300.1 hypothetical protein BME96_09025 [Virgibacillus halodenitrificans]
MQSLIHIAGNQDDKLLDYIEEKDYWEDIRERQIAKNWDTFDFTTFANKNFSKFLKNRNRIIIPDKQGYYVEFIIEESSQVLNQDGSRGYSVFTTASYLELQKQAVIHPQKLTDQSATSATGLVLNGTEWTPGRIEGEGSKTFVIEEHTDPYAALKMIAKDFSLELHFRIEIEGNKIVGRYVDLLQRIGVWRGYEVTFGHNLTGIERIEKNTEIVTALLGIGPADTEGNRKTVLVKDEEALKRWGRNGKHLIQPYYPQSTDQDMTLKYLTTLTENELGKRVNSQIEYKTSFETLSAKTGQHVFFGDTIRVKDEGFYPPLYLEARVHSMKESIKENSQTQSEVTLGDYIEYTEDEVKSIFRSLQSLVALKIDGAKLAEYTYDKVTIDSKDEVVFEDGKTFAQIRASEAQAASEQYATTKAEAERVKAESYADGIVTAEEQARINDVNAKLTEAKQHADTTAAAAESAAKTHADLKASQAQSNAEQHADTVAGQAEANAKAYAVAKTIYDAKMTEIAGDLADKAGLAYVDGQLVSKANKGDVYTISEVDNRLLNYVGVTKYQTDMDGIVTDLNSYSTRIGQNETAIGLKANQTEVDTLKGTVSDNSAQLNVQANQIASKVDATYVQGAIDGIEVGGRNLTHDSAREVYSGNTPRSEHTYWGSIQHVIAKLNIGDEITISFDVKMAKGEYLQVYNSNRDGELVFSPQKTFQNIGTSKQRLSFQTTIIENPGTVSRPGDTWLEFYSQYGSEDWYTISNVKIEKGNVATDWTPAPEDTQAQIDDNALIIEQHDTSITQLSNQITSKVETSVVNAIEGRVTANETTLTQYDTRINAKAESSTVDSLGVRMNTAEADIDGLNSTITLKADATVVGDLEDRVSSAEFTIDGMQSTISAKADRIELDGFVTATDLAVDGNLTFGGHLDGATGTFKGSIETPVLNINNPNLEQEGGVSLQLQTGLWQADVNKPFKETGYIEFNTLNDALEILAYDTTGNLRDLAGFTVRAAYTKFSGTVGFTEASGAQFDKYGNIGAPPSASETSSWNVLDYQGNPIFKAKWGADPLKEGIQILGKDFKIYNGSINIYGANRARITVGDDRTYIQAPKEVWNTQIASSTTVNSIAKAFNTVSTLDLKTDIKPIGFQALDLLNNSDLCEFKFKSDVENGSMYTKYGFIIGKGYRTPKEVLGDNQVTIDGYSHSTLNSKAIQELSVITTDHDERINFLEMENQRLKAEIEQLKGVA